MIRLARLTDYGILLLTHFARDPERGPRSARELSALAKLPLPTASKILKTLAHHGLLEAHRGVKGGFRLARKPEEITVAQIVTALEGPIGVTQCSSHSGDCVLEQSCIVRSNWRKINQVVLEALKGITLAEMARPLSLVPAAAPADFRRGVLKGAP